MPTDGLEERMAWRYPFEGMFLGNVPVRGTARVLRHKRRKSPVIIAFVPAQGSRCAPWFERVRERRDILEIEVRILRSFADKPGYGLGNHAAFLGQCPTFDQHGEIELLGRESFEGVLADGPKLAFVNILQQPVFEVCLAQLA